MVHILVIDDDETIREPIKLILMGEGFEVSAAQNGAEGVQMALATAPDLIVCDVSMPKMNGYDVLSELRQHQETATTPFIFLTGESAKAAMRRGMDLGADDYLTKPFTREELVSSIRTRMSRRAAVVDSFQREIGEVQARLARMVTHELKTPLVNFQLVKQIIDRQIENLSQSQIKELLGSLGAGSDRLNHIVDQMVYLTQINTNALNAEKVQSTGLRMELWQLMIGAVTQARSFAYQNKELEVVTDIPDREASLIGNFPSLKHALAELIANALNHSPATKPVEVGAVKNGEQIWIRVADHGKGMSPQQQAQALIPFEQIDRERNEQQGVGLGLPLAKKIVELHGGSLEIRSTEGGGTRVGIRLPATPVSR